MKKPCRKCGKEKELKDFPKSATCNDGRYHTCRECHNPVENEKRRQHRKDIADFYSMFL